MSARKKINLSDKHTMDVILIILGIALAIFTIIMIAVFCIYQTTPDSLIGCVFGAITGECGIMGWIKTNKERHETRRWELEDRKMNRIKDNLERMVDEDE